MSEFSSGSAVNFGGWLLKFGGQVFPHEYIKKGGWKSTPNQRLENDPLVRYKRIPAQGCNGAQSYKN